MVLAVEKYKKWTGGQRSRRKKIFWEQRAKVNMWLLPEQNKNSQRGFPMRTQALAITKGPSTLA